MPKKEKAQTVYLDKRDFSLLTDLDIADAILGYKVNVHNSKHWIIQPEDAIRATVSSIVADSYDPGADDDYLLKKKKQLTLAIGYISDLVGFSILECSTPAVAVNEQGSIAVSFMPDDERYCVMVQLQEHIGYNTYKQSFLEPFNLIDKTSLPHTQKVALFNDVKKIIIDTFDELCLNSPSVQVYPDHVHLEKHLLGSYDFSLGHSTFSDILHYHLGNMVALYCNVLSKLHIGGFVNGVFATQFIVRNLELELGYVVLMHCPDTE